MSSAFDCAICQRTIALRWEPKTGPCQQLAPVCRYCEHDYTRGVGDAKAGSFRDRREVRRGLALAAALSAEAHAKQWRGRYAS